MPRTLSTAFHKFDDVLLCLAYASPVPPELDQGTGKGEAQKKYVTVIMNYGTKTQDPRDRSQSVQSVVNFTIPGAGRRSEA